MSDADKHAVLDRGYVELIESWGSDESIISAARMSTAKGFLGWGQDAPCRAEDFSSRMCEAGTKGCEVRHVGDEKLLKYLWDHAHHTPFEMAGLTIEVKAPIMVFREWHRHRVPFGYNEMSARYVPLPDENYVPDADLVVDRARAPTTNRQAQGAASTPPDRAEVQRWLQELREVYEAAQNVYARGLEIGIPKELARLPVPVGRYSVMRATGNLRGWLAFLKLRIAPGAQWEIRQYATVVAALVHQRFPRTYSVARESIGMP